MEDREFQKIVVCVKHGLDWHTATTLDPLYREAFYYAASIMEGYNVDWETGELIEP